MLFRRMTRHIRDQDWTAVFLDFTVVVVGIFVALQVDNWNQFRLDRAEEQELIAALAVDFDRTESLFSAVKGFHELAANAGQAIITYGEAGIVPESERARFETLLSNHGARWVFTPVMGTLESLLGTNKINLLRNRELVSRLTQWPQLVESLNAEEIDAKDHYHESIFPFLATRIDFEDHDKGFKECCFDNSGSGAEGIMQIEYPWEQEATDAYLLVQDREFLNLIYWHWVHSMNKLVALRELEETLFAIQALLDDELND